MKYVKARRLHGLDVSHPSRGAWIEIFSCSIIRCMIPMSHPSRGAWIEMDCSASTRLAVASHPSRGAWIEIRETFGGMDDLETSHPSRGAWIEIPPR